ncbi:protein kinase domain-containing protein [Actinomadura craniellae]|uniref:protein kinase domain-containing protein n=1 Tax=Actinomadura craniellae TaxID=2231787 RepID=UPI001F447AE4|nr:protein kinase [Actinomadura craniellae]
MTEQTMPETEPLRAGDPERLGAYEIFGRLGEGGQGAVFLGRRPGGEFAAIKLLHATRTSDPAARARFVRELEVAKRVARFCTAQVLDADVAGDRPYIVSEYVSGRSLHHLVRTEGPRGGGALERLAISTLTALTAIHQAGVVHRDFKPHNVMIGPDGPRVIDFGVARALGAAGETQNVGTPAYMAPEHFSGEPPGPAADMFAWGVTMVFAATGRPAFGNDEMAAVMNRILTTEPDLRALAGPLHDVVAACLAKDPALRPGAREAQERLVGAATGSAFPPAVPTPLEDTHPAARPPGTAPADEPPRPERPAGQPPAPSGPAPSPLERSPIPLGQASAAHGQVPVPPEQAPPPAGRPPAPSEQAPILPGAIQTPPEQAPALPGAMQAPPEQALSLPGAMQAPPEQAPALPGAMQAPPEQAPALPGAMQVPPEQAISLPGAMQAPPGQAPAPSGQFPAPAAVPPGQAAVPPGGSTAQAPLPSGTQPAGPFPPGGGAHPYGPVPAARRRRVLPLIGAAAVGALLVGGSVWAATLRGDGPPDGRNAEVAGNLPGAGPEDDSAAGAGGPGTVRSPGATPSARPSERAGASAPPQNAPSRPPGSKPPAAPPPGTGGTGGGTQRTNPYTAQQVCGGGYYVQRSSAFSGGRTYQLYNTSTKNNCVVTLKTVDVGRPTRVWAKLEAQGGGTRSDSGSFSYYAGPVYVEAPGKCVRYSGGVGSASTSVGWANCG